MWGLSEITPCHTFTSTRTKCVIHIDANGQSCPSETLHVRHRQVWGDGGHGYRNTGGVGRSLFFGSGGGEPLIGATQSGEQSPRLPPFPNCYSTPVLFPLFATVLTLNNAPTKNQIPRMERGCSQANAGIPRFPNPEPQSNYPPGYCQSSQSLL